MSPCHLVNIILNISKLSSRNRINILAAQFLVKGLLRKLVKIIILKIIIGHGDISLTLASFSLYFTDKLSIIGGGFQEGPPNNTSLEYTSSAYFSRENTSK